MDKKKLREKIEKAVKKVILEKKDLFERFNLKTEDNSQEKKCEHFYREYLYIKNKLFASKYGSEEETNKYKARMKIILNFLKNCDEYKEVKNEEERT